MLPNFLCVGAQKAGTTTLHNILKQHPDIYLPELKEAHFFDCEDRYQKGLSWWIDTFFDKYSNEKIMGAITPDYLYYDEVPQMIYNDLGNDIKIIIVLRDPVERAYSHYLMSRRRGIEDLSFREAIETENERIKQSQYNRNHFSYVSRGFYLEQVKRYVNLFGKDQILFLSFEKDIINDIDNTIFKIEKFLEIEQIKLNSKISSNVASEPRYKIINKLIRQNNLLKQSIKFFIKSDLIKFKIKNFIENMNQRKILKKEPLNKQDRAKLIDLYQKEIIELSEITQLNFDHWFNKAN